MIRPATATSIRCLRRQKKTGDSDNEQDFVDGNSIMRVPSQYTKALHALNNKLHREFGSPEIQEELVDPVEQLVVGILASDGNTRRAKSAIGHLYEELIDINELRVMPVAELSGLIEPYVKDAEGKAREIVRALNWVFGKFNTLKLADMREQQQAELRTIFEKIPGCPDHATNAMLVFSFGASVFPVDQRMVDYLVGNEALPEGVDIETTEHYIERHFKAAELLELYLHVKEASEKYQGPSVKKMTKKKAVKKKAKKTNDT